MTGICDRRAKSNAGRVVRDSLPDLLSDLQRAAPVRTGALRASIDVDDDNNGGYFVARFRFPLSDIKQIYVSIDVPYARYNLEPWFHGITRAWFRRTTADMLIAYFSYYAVCIIIP